MTAEPTHTDTTAGATQSHAVWPTEPLPHIWVLENGLKACNAPYYDSLTGKLSGYCKVPVAHWDRWRRPAGTHRGDHQITWRDRN